MLLTTIFMVFLIPFIIYYLLQILDISVPKEKYRVKRVPQIQKYL